MSDDDSWDDDDKELEDKNVEEAPGLVKQDTWGQDDGDDWAMEEEDDDWANEKPPEEKDYLGETKGPKFKILEEEMIRGIMDKSVETLKEMVTDESNDNVRLLLQYYKWKPNKATDLYFGEMEVARVKSGVEKAEDTVPAFDTDDTECQICFCDYEPSEFLSLECGHKFCKECWDGQLEVASKKNSVITLKCPEESCPLVITTERLGKMGLEKNSESFKLFQKQVNRFQMTNFIGCNKAYKFCPGVGCEKIIQVLDSSLQDTVCDCGKMFCWSCSHDAHSPCPCKVAEAWRDKNAGATDDDMKWIISNSKKCPGCSYWIERSQGCNHMTCRRQECGHEFCWMCGADWKTHGSSTGGYYKCNIYEAKKADKKVYDRENAAAAFQEELKKYQWYFERYHNHEQAQKKMLNTMDQLEKKMRELEEKCGWKGNESAFIRAAGKLVANNRRLLAWSYVIGFYLPTDYSAMELFQDWQGKCEEYTDNLHAMLEKETDTFKEIDFRQKVLNYQRVIEKFYKNLMEVIQDKISVEAFPKGWKAQYVDFCLEELT